MLKFLTTSLAAAVLATSAQAVTVDLTDGDFTTVTGTIIPGDPLVFTETAGGVTFTFTALNNLVGVTRFLSGAGDDFSDGIVFGGGGGSSTQFSISSSQDVSVTSYSGRNSRFLVNPRLSVSAGGSTLVSGRPFTSDADSSYSLPNALGNLLANVDYTLTVTNAGSTTQGFLTGFEFEPVSAAVPLPASLPLLLAGLGGIAVMRRRRRS